MQLFVQDRNGAKRPLRIDESAPLGGGGEGKIYADEINPGVAVKLFSQIDPKRKAKIEAMLANPPGQARDANGHGHADARLAWPEGIVIDKLGLFKGLAMPRIDTAQYTPLDALLIERARKGGNLRGDSATDYRFRVRIAINIAKALDRVHAAGHALVDIKPLNIFVHTTSGAVAIVDCDGSRVVDTKRFYPAVVATEEYLAPEFHGKVDEADQRQDRFALAMVIFRLLNNDLLPMTGVPSDPNAPASHVQRIKTSWLTVNPAVSMKQHAKSIQDSLPSETLVMFRNAFSAVSALRPKAGKWVTHLEWLESQLSACPRDSKHAALPGGCPWCTLNERRAASDTSRNAARARAARKPANDTQPERQTASAAQPRAVPNRTGTAGQAGQKPGSPGHLLAARWLSLPFALLGFAFLALVVVWHGLMLYGMLAEGLFPDTSLTGRAAELLIRFVLFGMLGAAMGFPFYYAYINSWALEPHAKPGRVWPCFLLGFPAAIALLAYSDPIVELVLGHMPEYVYELSPIAAGIGSWSGIGTVFACIILFYGYMALFIGLRLTAIAFFGLWSKSARDTFTTELGV